MLVAFFRNEVNNIQYFYEADNSYVLFSSNNNMAIRKKSYQGKCQYQLDQKGGEDVYLCLSHLRQKNRYMINQNLAISHFPRLTLASLARQFFSYGSYFVSAINRVGYQQFEIFVSWNKHKNPQNIFLRLPGRVLLYITFFHFFLLGLLLMTLGPGVYARILGLCLLVPYLLEDLRMFSLGFSSGIKIMFAKFVVNSSLLLGALKESIKDRLLVLTPGIKYCWDNFLLIEVSPKCPVANIKLYQNELESLLKSEKYCDEICLSFTNYLILLHEDVYFLLQKRRFFYGHKVVNIEKNLLRLPLLK